MNTATQPKKVVHGVLAIDKPSGPTSFDVVARVRRTFRTKSVGHAGTLDPLATGVLVVMLGEATKLSEYLTAADKEYVAEVTFGRSTDTLDVTGTTIESRVLNPGAITLSAVESAIADERARQWQIPPEYSAIKVAGQPAYARARRGETLELAPRKVAVTRLSIQAFDGVSLSLNMRVSKGYYVRSLIRDVCTSLGVPGCMSALRRTASGPFEIASCSSWAALDDPALPAVMSVSEAVRFALPWGVVNDEGTTRARQGKRLDQTHFQVVPLPGNVAGWLDPEYKLVALGERVEATSDGDAYFRVVRGFTSALV